MQNMESQFLPPLLNPRTNPPPFFFFFFLLFKINILSLIYPEINFPAEPVMKINYLSRPKVPGPPSESNGRPLTKYSAEIVDITTGVWILVYGPSNQPGRDVEIFLDMPVILTDFENLLSRNNKICSRNINFLSVRIKFCQSNPSVWHFSTSLTWPLILCG